MIFLGLLAIFMAGCSKVVEHVSLHGEEVRYEWMTDLSLPVPLIFDFETVSTKGTINELADLADKDFAFFAVNKNAEDLTEEKDIVFPDNTKARSRKGEDGEICMDFVGPAGEQASYYYPIETEDNYSFYAYHSTALGTSTPPEPITVDGKSILVDVPVAVFDDILWGAAEAQVYTDENSGVRYDGFNSRYIRNVGVNPSIEFQHPASCLSFQITRKDSTVPSLRILSVDVSMVDIPTKATLCVLDKAEEGESHSGNFINSKEPKTVHVGKIGEAFLNRPSQALPDFFIAPQSEPITLKLEFKVVDGKPAVKDPENPGEYLPETPEIMSVTYEIDPTQIEEIENDCFERGKRYTCNLILHSPVNIDIQVDVERYLDAYNSQTQMEYDPNDFGLDEIPGGNF